MPIDKFYFNFCRLSSSRGRGPFFVLLGGGVEFVFPEIVGPELVEKRK